MEPSRSWGQQRKGEAGCLDVPHRGYNGRRPRYSERLRTIMHEDRNTMACVLRSH